MLSSSSILFGIVGLLQLEMTGFFDKIFQNLSDLANSGVYPSNIYRHVISNPETPIRTFFKDLLFYNRKCGLFFLLLASAIQIICVWI